MGFLPSGDNFCNTFLRNCVGVLGLTIHHVLQPVVDERVRMISVIDDNNNNGNNKNNNDNDNRNNNALYKIFMLIQTLLW